MEEILQKIIESDDYKALQSRLDDLGVNNRKVVGPVMTLCKKRKPKNFSEWFLFYVSLKYIANIQKMAMEISNQLNMNYYTCYECLIAFITFQTWNGYRMEELAKQELKCIMYSIREATSEEDLDYGVDLVLIRNGKEFYGIQVKPISYKKKEEKGADCVKYNLEKNKKYKERYGYDVINIYYNKDFKYELEEIERVKDIIRNKIYEELGVYKCKVL